MVWRERAGTRVSPSRPTLPTPGSLGVRGRKKEGAWDLKARLLPAWDLQNACCRSGGCHAAAAHPCSLRPCHVCRCPCRCHRNENGGYVLGKSGGEAAFPASWESQRHLSREALPLTPPLHLPLSLPPKNESGYELNNRQNPPKSQISSDPI
ncbi:hypothetical protein VTI74DRAFT_7047 [Chaetomium olivicolor]